MQTSGTTYKWGSPAGTQIYPVMQVAGMPPVVMGTIDTITHSSHRDKRQVRPCGFTKPRGIARGTRTIAGTMILKIFEGLELREILGELSDKYRRLLMDEMPPFNVYILIPRVSEGGNILANPMGEGGMSVIALLDIDIVDQAGSLSIDDQVVEQTVTYLARDIIDLGYVSDLQSSLASDDESEDEPEVFEERDEASPGEGVPLEDGSTSQPSQDGTEVDELNEVSVDIND